MCINLLHACEIKIAMIYLRTGTQNIAKLREKQLPWVKYTCFCVNGHAGVKYCMLPFFPIQHVNCKSERI